jgi:exodeoxyribonuclease VII large subunit
MTTTSAALCLQHHCTIMPVMPFLTPTQMPSSRETLSVSSLNRMARSLLENHFPNVAVEGEISNLSVPGSGHWYFTLKDDAAQIRCAMFRNRNLSVGFRPQDGKQIVVRGRLSIYEGRGDYQLIVDTMEEAGDGVLRRRFEMLKQKLAAEGLFESTNKQPMPFHIRHIGVITSATGAVIRDIVSVLGRRFPAIQITLLPVPVQGADAPAAIVRAIQIANQRQDELGLDVLIVGRGGGSLEDLQAFNEESVARAIFASSLPLVSAVGHETDYTIADLVADLRAPTPSAAAELLSPDQNEMLQTFAGYALLFNKLIRDHLRRDQQRLSWLLKQLKHPGRRLQEHAQTLDILEGRLLRATRHQLQHKLHALQDMQQGLLRYSPVTRMHAYSVQTETLRHRLHRAAHQRIELQQSQLAQLVRSLDAVSPLQTLQRGYSITRDKAGRVLRSSSALQIGNTIVSNLASGSVHSTVTKLEHSAKITDN